MNNCYNCIINQFIIWFNDVFNFPFRTFWIVYDGVLFPQGGFFHQFRGLGESYLRIACAALTSQLCICDLIHDLPFLKDYLDQVIEVIHFIIKIDKEFKKYYPLTGNIIPSQITSIEYDTFDSCSSIKNAFHKCTRLKEILFLSDCRVNW